MHRPILMAALVFGLGSASAQTSPQNLPRAQASNLLYRGYITAPDAASGPEGTKNFLSFGGGALGKSTRGLYVGCHDQENRVAEIAIPAIGGQAMVLQPCTEIPGLDVLGIDVANGAHPGSLLLHNGRLIVTAYGFYGDITSGVSHIALNPATGAGGPWVKLQAPAAGWVGGYMFPIPPEWQTLFGGPAMTGQCCLSIISRTSSGPTVSVFNPDDVGRANPVPATLVLGYPLDHPLEQTVGGQSNAFYTRGDQVAGGVFPAGTRSVLFLTSHGNGPYCYGDGAPCGDPVRPGKGEHEYPYIHQILAYDATDLLAVKNGAKQSWEIRPYARWTLTEMSNSGSAAVKPGGMTYDPVAKRLYVTDGWGGGARRVHLYDVVVSSQPPPPPPPPPAEELCGNGRDDDGDGLIDEGCAPPTAFTVTPPALSCTWTQTPTAPTGWTLVCR